MLNFQYFTPTKVVFGKDAELKVGPLVKEEGCKKVLVHYGGQSAKKSGLLDRVCEALKDFDIDYVTLGGVVPNPHLSKVGNNALSCDFFHSWPAFNIQTLLMNAVFAMRSSS